MPDYDGMIAQGGDVGMRARLVVEGWPDIFVSHPSMAGNRVDGRRQIAGMRLDSMRIAARVKLAQGDLVGQEMTVDLVENPALQITESLTKKPTLRSFLTGDLDEGHVATMSVSDTSAWPSTSYVHVGREVIAYSSKASSVAFASLTRGVWDTIDQAHFTPNGIDRSYPHVTDRPRSLMGRRVYLYILGSTEAADADGTLRWRGFVSSSWSFSEGVYSFTISPISELLEQPIGGDLEEPLPLRGIYLPNSGALKFRIYRRSGANNSDSPTSDSDVVTVSGFFADQQAFCDEVTAALTTATSTWSWDAGTLLEAEPVGRNGWRIVYRTGPTNAYYVGIAASGGPARADQLSPVDRRTNSLWRDVASTAESPTLVTDRLYEMHVDAPVPRQVLGDGGGGFHDDPLAPSLTPNRVYVGGSVEIGTPTIFPLLQIDPGGDGDPTAFVPAVGFESGASDIYFRVFGTSVPYLLLGPSASVRMVRGLAVGGLGDLVDALIADSPGLANAGAMPLLTSADISTDHSEIEAAESSLRITQRAWYASKGVSLRDVLVHEARLRGLFLSSDTTGKMEFRRLRAPLKTDVASHSVTAKTAVGRWPVISDSPFGHLGRVVFHRGWSYEDNEHNGTPVVAKDVSAVGSPGVLDVAPRSSLASGADAVVLSIDDYYLLASSVLGLFGSPYRIVDIEVALVHFDAALGDVVSLSTNFLPDDDGTMGLTTKEGLLIGYDWSPMEAKGRLRTLLLGLDTAGYSPSFLVSSASGSGTSWDLTLTLSPYTSESDIATWLAVGDEVRVIERDARAPTIVVGTIDEIISTTQVGVTFDSSWAGLGGGEYFLGYDATDQVDESAPSSRTWAQTDFAKCAGDDRRIALASGDIDAQEWAP